MDRPLAGFRELRDVEPADEALLHEAGVHSWEALSKVLDALGRRRGQALEELARQVAERCPAADGEPGRGDGTAAGAPPEIAGDALDEEPAPTSRHHRVVLDAGKAIGGGRHAVALAVSTAALADGDELAYSASLVAWPVGRASTGDDAPWVGPSGRVGRAVPPRPIWLRFDDVALPPGVHRLQVRLAVTLRDPVAGPLPLQAIGEEAEVLDGTAAVQV